MTDHDLHRHPGRWFALLALACLAFAPGRAHAALCGTVLTPISASATAVNFGNYDPGGGSAVQASGTITVRCSLLIDVLPSFTVSLSRGQSTTYFPRTMLSGAHALSYNLYTSSALATVWGDGSGGTSTVTNSGVLQVGSLNLTVYGAIPTGQYVNPGSYADSITVTVTY
ncbi:spore coat U domain-containing protein [Oleiagrimonas sp. MCCC 1A03011]|uniref:Csu type fimbrial protein n=1 Tax=Oleiagrimonas sp. MCCC 1A03011 TaxID=1926883 RepID=UPI000DC34BF5|nr:spore coat U domain-containing protein [Oleiagrimonas sp. MCCC 1A03011]RAP59344.1 hypothetical protein BTJ49_01355 [Oleiagrimonas sp. MCCC 1A03011]